jgi:hypothetical protein
MLVLENAENNTAQLHMVSGPYPEGVEAQRVVWKNWLQEVKGWSEVN